MKEHDSTSFNPCQKHATGPRATEEPRTSTSTSNSVHGSDLLMPTLLQDTSHESYPNANDSTVGEADPLTW